jgi:hypothetical protein
MKKEKKQNNKTRKKLMNLKIKKTTIMNLINTLQDV